MGHDTRHIISTPHVRACTGSETPPKLAAEAFGRPPMAVLTQTLGSTAQERAEGTSWGPGMRLVLGRVSSIYL